MTTQKLLGGRYQLIRVIGIKAHSKTYLTADQQYPGHPKCVVKHLTLPARNPVTLKFLTSILKKKAMVLEQLGQQAEIAPINSTFHEGQDFYLVRPFVPGISLKQALQDRQAWPEAEVLTLLKAVLTALVAIQERGVIHHNLQPTNLIRRQQDNHWVLVDFSLVQDIHPPMASAVVNGTAASSSDAVIYASPSHPHRFRDFSIDHFALGLMALQAATGLSPDALPRQQQPYFLAQVQQLLQTCPSLSSRTQGLIYNLVTPQPDRRFLQAKDILERLSGSEAILLQPAVADPAPPQKSGWPFSSWKANRLQWGLLGLVSAALVTGLIGGLRVPQRFQAHHWRQQAAQAEAAGEQAAALTHLNEVIQLQPHDGEALAQRAAIHWQRGETERALQDLAQAIQAQPKVPQWPYQRGNLRFQLGDLQGAISDYTTALTLDPTYAEAYVNRGSARADWGDEQGAVEDYTAALDQMPESVKKAPAYLNRCLSLSNLGRQAEALADCTAAINLRPDYSLAYQNRGLVRRRLNDLQGALQDFTIAIQIEPNSPDPYYNRGLTRRDLGDTSGALADFNQALTLDPRHVFARYDRGLLYAELAQFSDAIADFEQTASQCLDLGRVGCFEDAQYQIQQLRQDAPPSDE